MDKTKKYLTISFIVVLIAVIILSAVGMLLLKKKPVVLQGQIEATEIRISGKLPGRIDTFLVKEGQNVKAGDTLVVINSPEAQAKYQQVPSKILPNTSTRRLTTVRVNKSSPPSNSFGTKQNQTCNWLKQPTTVSRPFIRTV